MTEDYQVIQLIDEIGATSSRIEKEELVKQLAALDLGNFVLRMAYDPFITFGIKAPGTEGQGKMSFKQSLVAPILNRLANRELTGNAAERELSEIMAFLDERGARLMFLILSKDLKCGIAEGIINAAVPGLIPQFAVMRAHTYEPKRIAHGFKAEFKLDGQRNTFLCKDGHGGFFTRSGKVVPALDFLVPIVLKVAAEAVKMEELKHVLRRPGEIALNFMLDGEAMMGLFEETGALRRKGVDARGAELHLYDILSYDDFDAVGDAGPGYSDRRQQLTAFISAARHVLKDTPEKDVIQITPSFFVNADEDVQVLFQRARSMTLAKYLARGDEAREKQLEQLTIDKATGKPKVLEGLVIKDPVAQYQKKKSHAWLKLKSEETEDLRITGAYPGEPHTKYEHCLGGLQVDYKGVPVNVGGGFSDDEREEIWKLWLADLKYGDVETQLVANNKKLFVYTPTAGYQPKLMRRLIEVEFMEVTPDGSLRHPRYVRFRDDKDGELECKQAA